MELNRNINNDFQEIVNTNEEVFSTRNLHYLYPNGHRMTNQMIWLKGGGEKTFRSDISA